MRPPINAGLKIGIVINYKKAEKKKEELLSITSSELPWLTLAKEKRYSKYIINRNGKKHVPYDVAIGLYIEHYYPKVEVDYILPHHISKSRFKQNDLVFIVIYDLLEAFHLSNKSKFKKFKHALKTSGNVYPPYEYQKFINNKCIYYKYLKEQGIKIVPTKCVTKKKWFARDSDKYVSKLVKKIKKNEWESVIAKPVFGQESIGFGKFMGTKKTGLLSKKKKLMRYFNKNFPKYKSIVLQEYIPGFDKDNQELRFFFVNGKYQYSMVTSNKEYGLSRHDGGKAKTNRKLWNSAKRLANRTIKILPKLKLPGIQKSPIITRVDIGTGLGDTPGSCFVNEVEFVPSLFVEEINHSSFPILRRVAESLVKVAGVYKKKSKKKKY